MEHSQIPAVGIFCHLTDAQRALLAAKGEFQELKLGANVVKQGDTQTHLHMLVEGILTATCQGLGSVVSLGEIKPGEIVGEMNFLDPMKASATVKAKVTSVLWSIPCDTLNAYCDEDPVAGLMMMRDLGKLLARRIRKAADKLLRQAESAVAIYEMD